ncbi:MAG: hypothetical protein IKF14_05490 [Atopobiaceae bacterium]|nr:hypothetical protein [Atopobiaceae bacterium]
MFEWCHSGLEGYCKASAALLGEGDEATAWLAFCKDLLPDRTQKTLTRAWTLSNARQGRSCRQALFEKCWLAGRHGKVYLDEAESFARDTVPEGGFATIPQHSSYERQLMSCVNDAERRQLAISRCEQDAIDSCVSYIVDLASDDAAVDAAYITSLVMRDGFAIDFFTSVIPAIERGLLSERYRTADIQQFALTLNALSPAAHRCIVSEGADLEPFSAFLKSLVAGLIYGPVHPVAIGRAWDATQDYLPYDQPENPQGTTLRLTQLFDERGRFTGYSDVYHTSQLVLFGRSPSAEDYERRCTELFGDEPALLAAIRSREEVIFPIALHDAVSNVHGMLLCEEGVWRFYDLASSNGTSIASESGTSDVAYLVEVRAGDCLRLGAPASAHDANAFWDAATIRATLHVNRVEEIL